MAPFMDSPLQLLVPSSLKYKEIIFILGNLTSQNPNGSALTARGPTPRTTVTWLLTVSKGGLWLSGKDFVSTAWETTNPPLVHLATVVINVRENITPVFAQGNTHQEGLPQLPLLLRFPPTFLKTRASNIICSRYPCTYHRPHTCSQFPDQWWSNFSIENSHISSQYRAHLLWGKCSSGWRDTALIYHLCPRQSTRRTTTEEWINFSLSLWCSDISRQTFLRIIQAAQGEQEPCWHTPYPWNRRWHPQWAGKVRFYRRLMKSTLLIGRTIFPTTLLGKNQVPRLSEFSTKVALVQRQMTLD